MNFFRGFIVYTGYIPLLQICGIVLITILQHLTTMRARSNAKRTHPSLPLSFEKNENRGKICRRASRRTSGQAATMRLRIIVVVETRGNPSPPHLPAEEESSQGGNNPAVGGVEGVGSGSDS